MRAMRKSKHYAILPGSYDPVTKGHIDILRRASELYDKVYLALLINPDKSYLFDMETRVKLAEIACRDIKNAVVVSDTGMLVELASRLGCDTIIKGIRDGRDLAYEVDMARRNRALAPDIETLFMPASEEYSHISSTEVRRLLFDGNFDEAKKLLPDGTLDIIKDCIETERHNK